ncbi:30S ribosomal protein S20 [Candidatus Kaiserbacteria bacterium RIFCSPHIGHO2_01_FULL_55_17]|uniref:Small ribosomal subunit protein bS20 n=1 Tax=Candidatus Kaiserbacteria bacterium RIFCSPHIGHO2_01_FULL_55_17 TaxID=1798484 RepID=A0A1F6DB66_9BACT|nr:MAG: 30S ribosomal protein S20 [Candidatus Kaiserbacteria bacterium RIFCSPHIGHO2_01_FULL_55_17]
MANIRSAKKAHRASLRRRVFNARRTKASKGAVKDIARIIAAKDKKAAEGMLSALYKAIDKAAKNGTLKKNTAARMKSRISKRVRAIAP